MGVFDKFADAPDQIKKEGQEITVKFTRTGPTTGRVTWNIPPPAAGCAAGTQAYDGIVITVNGKAVNYLSNSPKDGTYYTPDATGDADVHAGDKLDGALVVGAFYHDKTTTFLDLSDILPKTPYYVSAYAVDNVGRYHREGAHAYSLPTGESEWSLPDKAAKHDITIDVVGGIDLSTLTGLQAGTEYTFVVKIDGKEYTIVVDGVDVTNYADLVTELKKKLALLGDVTVSALPPFANTLWYNAATKELKMWDGTAYVDIPVLVYSEDPTMQSIDAYWYTPSTKVLKKHDGSNWAVTPFISLPYNPTTLACDQAWFDGTNVWVYKLTHWEKLHTYIQTRNPLLGPLLTCDDYWYDTIKQIVSVWDVDAKAWKAVNPIYFGTDPTLLNTGAFWYDEKTAKVKRYVSGSWNVLAGVKVVESLPADDDDYSDVAGTDTFLFDLETGKLFEFVTSVWVERAIVSYNLDPRDRTKSKLWWNSTTDQLNAWDDVEEEWVLVTSFTQSATSPHLPAALVEPSAWYNPETKEVKLVFKTACKTIYPIIYNISPGALPVGTVWYDSDDNKWYEYNGTTFIQFDPMYFETDPYAVVTGYYWYDLSEDKLKRWNGTAWVEVVFSAHPVGVTVGMFWFNTVNDQLYVWTGKTWVESLGLASVELISPETAMDRSILSFFTRGIGCGSTIEVMTDGEYLLSFLTQPVMYADPISGASGLRGGSLAQHLGVGDNGSPDERRAIHTFIRNALGAPVIQVELTKEQIDLAIDLGLAELRKFSSYSYRRQVFFLDLKPNQQTYIMTNKCVGFNKIVGVNSIHRHRGLAMGAGAAGNDAFTYGAIQRLYSVGTFDMLSYHLVSAYMEELETLFAARIMFNWKELERELSIYTRMWHKERVLIDAYVERPEQDLMIDRQTGLWLKRFTLAESKKILSQGRGKFVTLPGPNGSTTLNAQDLQTQAEGEIEKLREQLEDMSMQDLAGIGLRTHLILG